MKSEHFIDFGEEVSKTVKKVLNSQDFYDLKNMINRTSQNRQDPFSHLAKEYPTDNRTHENFRKVKIVNQNKDSKGFSIASILFLVFGFIGAITSGLVTLIGIITEVSVGNIPALTAVNYTFGILFFISLILIIVGLKLKKRMKRFKLYQKVLNGRTYCMIQDLAVASGENSKFIIKDIRKMIKAGIFKEGYLDEQETCLMVDYKTYIQYLETMKNAKEQKEIEEREKEKWASFQGGIEVKQAIDEGKKYIQIIKEANYALAEVEISEKLDKLETITTKIFDYVEKHPEKLSEIRKFMSYYMPITLKLVKAYQNFDGNVVDADEIIATKIEIKDTLDTINLAYENLLKKLMQADILDVSSDISALQTILAQEGLTEEDFIRNRATN